MKRLLVTGASGFLGWNVCRIAPKEWDIYGTVFSHEMSIPGIKLAKVDLTDSMALKSLFKTIRPDAVIHTAAASSADFCQVRREESHRINVDAAIQIAALCSDYQVPYVFTSSDLIFDGQRAPYRETDPVCPVSIYGEQKVLAEEGIGKTYPEAAICRMPLMFGISGSGRGGLIEPMLSAMREGQELHLFTDEFRTPVSAQSAVSGIFIALQKARGILHLGGAERISRYDFGRLIAEIFKEDRALLVSCKQADAVTWAPRPKDVSLSSTNAFLLGYSPAPLVEEIGEIQRSLVRE